METKDNEIEQKTNQNEFEQAPVYEVKTKAKYESTESYFDGGVLELIGWKLLGLIITVISFGIASPWAQCMIYRWQYKHTVYNGKRLKFEGTGGDLFVNIFKWVFFSIITLGIYIIFIPVRKAKWVASNLHFEDEELTENESYFDGTTLQLIGINILSFIISVCSFGILYPFATCLKIRWGYKHTIVNRKRLVFDGNGLQLWGKTILWTLLTLVTLGIYAIWLPIAVLKWETKHVHIKKVDEDEQKDKSLYIVIPIAIILCVIGMVALVKIIPTLSEEKIDAFVEMVEDFVEGNRFSGLVSGKRTVNNESSHSISEKVSKPKTEEKQEQTSSSTNPTKKTSVTAGGYTLKFGTYYGQIEQGYWDDATMTSKSVYHDVYLVLTEDTITLDGHTSSYSISGTNIYWYIYTDNPVLQVTGNNRITYMAETCPELVYQGY